MGEHLNNGAGNIFFTLIALFELPEAPGVIFSEPPRQETITSEGGEINFEEDMGVFISIPKDATGGDENIDVSTSLAVPC